MPTIAVDEVDVKRLFAELLGSESRLPPQVGAEVKHRPPHKGMPYKKEPINPRLFAVFPHDAVGG